MSPESIEPLAQFGAAGVMGAMWLWERMLSRRREAQINQAHDRLMREREQFDLLIRLVRRNTRAIEHFSRTQDQLKQILERMHQDEADQSEAA